MCFIYFTFLFSFYISSGICFLYDYLDKNNIDYNKIMYQYKNIYRLVNFNSFIYIPLISIPYEKYFINNSSFNLNYSIIRILISIISLDFYFYFCHKIMHNPIIYKWSHKIHHKYRDSVGMEALYLHWFDLYFGNILPLYIMMFYADIYTNIIWTIIIIISTVISHSNILKSNHNDHHKYFVYNYGLGMYMDKLLGTEY